MPVTMPTAADLGERPIPRPETQQLPPGDPGYVGMGEEALGKALFEAGANIQRVQARVNTMRADDAHTQLIGKALELNEGENGFSRLHGSDVVNQPTLDNYMKKFDEQSKQIRSTLANDFQRQAYDRRAPVTRLQYQQDLLRHIGNEGETYSKETFTGGVSTEQRNAGVHWMNQADVNLSIERINHLVQERAQHLGLPKDQADTLLVDSVSPLHREVIDSALAAGNYSYAKNYFDRVSPQMTPEDRKSLQAPMELVGAQSTGDNIISKYGTGNAAIQQANKLADPVLKARVMDEIERRGAIFERLRNEGERNVREQMSRKLEASDPTKSIQEVFTPREISAMSTQPGLLENMQNTQRERLNFKSVQTDPVVSDRLRTMIGKDPEGFKHYDITKDYGSLSRSDRDYFERAQADLNDPKSQPHYANESQILEQAYYEIGADKLAGTQKQELRGKFQDAYRNEVQAFVQQNKRQPNADEMRDITKRLQLPFVQTHPEWYKTNTTGPLFQLDRSVGGGLQVPDQDRQQIISAYRQLYNRAPNDDEIMRAYVTRPR